eukprot:TRINITY_DN5506_c0_g1_i1.p1 TRINITY_DN5506_c0_g1~~TRINITY_DN5506_c0_g1_i1.p1  ORF type:complete len:901 (+),score=179.13 TRINITY_DN5506_c0_g1_i1:164-2866(+)
MWRIRERQPRSILLVLLLFFEIQIAANEVVASLHLRYDGVHETCDQIQTRITSVPSDSCRPKHTYSGSSASVTHAGADSATRIILSPSVTYAGVRSVTVIASGVEGAAIGNGADITNVFFGNDKAGIVSQTSQSVTVVVHSDVAVEQNIIVSSASLGNSSSTTFRFTCVQTTEELLALFRLSPDFDDLFSNALSPPGKARSQYITIALKFPNLTQTLRFAWVTHCLLAYQPLGALTAVSVGAFMTYRRLAAFAYPWHSPVAICLDVTMADIAAALLAYERLGIAQCVVPLLSDAASAQNSSRLTSRTISAEPRYVTPVLAMGDAVLYDPYGFRILAKILLPVVIALSSLLVLVSYVYNVNTMNPYPYHVTLPSIEQHVARADSVSAVVGGVCAVVLLVSTITLCFAGGHGEMTSGWWLSGSALCVLFVGVAFAVGYAVWYRYRRALSDKPYAWQHGLRGPMMMVTAYALLWDVVAALVDPAWGVFWTLVHLAVLHLLWRRQGNTASSSKALHQTAIVEPTTTSCGVSWNVNIAAQDLIGDSLLLELHLIRIGSALYRMAGLMRILDMSAQTADVCWILPSHLAVTVTATGSRDLWQFVPPSVQAQQGHAMKSLLYAQQTMQQRCCANELAQAALDKLQAALSNAASSQADTLLEEARISVEQVKCSGGDETQYANVVLMKAFRACKALADAERARRVTLISHSGQCISVPLKFASGKLLEVQLSAHHILLVPQRLEHMSYGLWCGYHRLWLGQQSVSFGRRTVHVASQCLYVLVEPITSRDVFLTESHYLSVRIAPLGDSVFVTALPSCNLVNPLYKQHYIVSEIADSEVGKVDKRLTALSGVRTTWYRTIVVAFWLFLIYVILIGASLFISDTTGVSAFMTVVGGLLVSGVFAVEVLKR